MYSAANEGNIFYIHHLMNIHIAHTLGWKCVSNSKTSVISIYPMTLLALRENCVFERFRTINEMV